MVKGRYFKKDYIILSNFKKQKLPAMMCRKLRPLEKNPRPFFYTDTFKKPLF